AEPNHHLTASGRRLLSVDSGRVREWDMETGRLTHTYRGIGKQEPLDEGLLSADGRTLAMNVEDRVRLWDVRAGRAMGTLPDVAPSTWDFSPSGQLLATTDDVTAGAVAVDESGTVAEGTAADGEFVAALADNEILLWRFSSPGTPVFRYPVANERPTQLALDTTRGTIRYVNGGGTVVRTLSLGRSTSKRWQQKPGRSAQLSPDGRTLAAVREHGSTPTLDLVDGRSGSSRGSHGRALGEPCPKQSTYCHDHIVAAPLNGTYHHE
ncbi:WD40 repeat domain-containing protein, partial [Streptomyces spectabilis]